MKLIETRECADCTACCTHIPIDQPDMVKLPNVECENLLETGGCRIYKTRPDTCAKWYCAWRYIPILSDGWRPDRMGVLVDFCNNDYPNDFSAKMGLNFLVLDKEKVFKSSEFARFIASQIDYGVQCVISYGPDPEQKATTAVLNFALKDAVVRRDKQAIIQKLHWVLNECESARLQTFEIQEERLTLSS